MKSQILGLCAALYSADAVGDLQRARTKVPRDEFRGVFKYDMSKVLNSHLVKTHPNTMPCHQWTSADLQELQAQLHQHREVSLDAVYQDASDNRAMRHATLEGAQSHWNRINAAASAHPLLSEMQRDGHCHEAVMWWVHHISEDTKKELAHLKLPTLPLQHWREPIADEGQDALTVYKDHYHPSSTCLSCHGGGIPWQADPEPAPLPRQLNGNDRKRRCEEWYGDEEGGKCGPCEGMAGSYWGDAADDGIYPECEIIAQPEDVPVEQRTPAKFPRQFSVEMRGSDRWPRASASANASCTYTTDCSPYVKELEGQPVPPMVNAHWYSQLHGVLTVDHFPGGQFGGGRLRHESVYEVPSGREGAERALKGIWGINNSHLTEIHIQSPEWAHEDPPFPGIMLNIVHKNMTEANASGVDDSKLDWRRIPSTDGGAVCVQDPGGMPFFEGAFDNGTYTGRIKFVPQWQKTSVGGLPDGVPVIADTYVKWNFHIYIDIETKKPVMFSSPYGGSATYGNWSTPDEFWPGGWEENPPRENVFNPSQNDRCIPYSKPKVEQMMV